MKRIALLTMALAMAGCSSTTIKNLDAMQPVSLQPSDIMPSKTALAGKAPRVIDGPFAETKELIAGFWIWKVKSMDEALDWARRCPMLDGDVLEIRPVFEAEDFGEAFTPELRAQEERIMAEAQKLAKKT